MHPNLPILASSSGQHHFSIYSSVCSEEEEMDVEKSDQQETVPKLKENSLIFWWCGKLKQNF